jgi:hypothetical protein
MNALKLWRKQFILVWFAAMIWQCAVPAQDNSADLPPSPFSLPASTEPQSAWY